MEERLELDISDALAGVEQIESALTSVAQGFKVGLAEALDLLSSVVVEEVDASAVTAGIDEAVLAADLEPEVSAEASGVTSEIDAAVGAADTDLEVAADASAVTASIDEAVDGADTDVEVNAVVDSVTDAIEAAVADADSTVEIDADTSGAEAAIEDLGAAGDSAAGGVNAAGIATENLGNLSAASTGSVLGLESALDEMGTTGKVVSGVIAAVATSAGVLINAALEADTADRRFAASLGDVADAVNTISVEGVADDFATLAQQTGNSDEAMKLAVARLADLGASAGATGDVVASTAEDITLLAIRASVMNPTLGDAGAVADRMTNAFARGGRALAPFGIALSSAEINLRAVTDTGKATAADLTIFDKAAAGAALATEKLGDSLRTDIAEGTESTQVQLRILRQEFGDTLEIFGQPLLEPALEGIRAGQPLLLGLAETFGELGELAIPLAVEALEAFAPIMGTTTDLLTIVLQVLQPVIALIDAIPDPLLQAAAAMALFNRVGAGLGTTIGRLAGSAGGGLRSLPALLGAINPVTAAVTVGVGLLAVAWQKHAKEQAESNARVREGAAAFQDEAQAIGDTIEAIATKRIPENQLDDIRRMGLTYQEAGELAADSVGGFDAFITKAEEAGEITSSVADALRANGGDVRDLKLNFEALGVSQRDLNDSNLGLLDTFASLSGETQESAKSALEHLSATGSLTAAQQELVDAVLDSTSGNINYVGVLEDVKGTSDDATGGTEGFTGALGDQEDQAILTQEALQVLYDATIGFINSTIAAEQAGLNFADSLVDVREKQEAVNVATREHGVGSAEAAAAQRDYEDAVRSARDAAVAQAEAQVRLASDTAIANGTTLSAEESQRIFVTSLQGAAAQADGPTRDAINNLLTTASGLDAFREVQIKIEADTRQAENDLRNLQIRLDQLDRGLLVTVGKGGGGFRMAGGPVGPGTWVVGEDGPEVLQLNAGGTGYVFSNQSTETRRELRDTASVAIDYDQLAQAFAREAARLRPNDIQVFEAADPRVTAHAIARELGDEANA